MTELDQIWSQMLGEAAIKAGADGRRHVADYLRLKATNDVIRTAGVAWLFDSMAEIALADTRNGLTVEREESHSFERGSSKMVGSRLNVRLGVRCLSLEAGWARIPSDGIMQNGALAYARIKHFGMPKAAELRLVLTESLPSWLDESDSAIESSFLAEHFKLLIGT